MSIQLNLDQLSNIGETKSCHSIPCKIKYNGQANVKKYFESSIIHSSEGEDLTASFRGRPLNGKKMELPQGYQGVVIKEKRKPLTEEEDQEFDVITKVPSFTYWNLDKPVTEEDKLSKALFFTELARAIHQRDFEDTEKQNGCYKDENLEN